MITIGYYLNNSGIRDVDLSCPEKGNPGIGGTQFNTITLIYYTDSYFHGRVRYILYANSISKMPDNIRAQPAENAVDALIQAERDGCQLFLWRATTNQEGFEMIDVLGRLNIKLICRAHNTPNRLLNKLAETDKVKRFVCVSHEQMDQLRDHPIIYKSVNIFNGFDPKPYMPAEVKKTGDEVTYVGSLVPTKGFHVLARIWPQIRQRHPGATLNVIGSGKLYQSHSVMGPWNLAEEKYEKKIRKYLANTDGSVDESVRLLGVLGPEKISILQRSCVGVANPTGISENCPASAIEFQACGTPVVAAARWGFLDTVAHKQTGLLGNSDQRLIRNILYFLQNKDDAAAYGRRGIKFIQEKFSHQTRCGQWVRLFEDVCRDRPCPLPPMKRNLLYDLKFIKEYYRRIKRILPGGKVLPSSVDISRLVLALRKKWEA